jgi:antitoxin component HigA of HigAB toxin-antitoxin module
MDNPTMTTLTIELPRSPVAARGPASLDFRHPHVIKTEEEYKAAIAMIHSLFDLGRSRSRHETNLLEFLTLLAETYEAQTLQMPEDASPQEVVLFLLEQNEMNRSDLSSVMGGPSRVSEFFSKTRALSRGQLTALREFFNVPLDLFVANSSKTMTRSK